MSLVIWCALLLLVVVAYRNRHLFTVQRPVNGCMWGYVTIPQGEKWNLCMTTGKIQTVEGPNVVSVWGAKLVQLQQVAATQAQYLWIQFLDGRADIMQGPASIHLDSSIHRQVKARDAVTLTDSEVLVVYREDNSAPTKAA